MSDTIPAGRRPGKRMSKARFAAFAAPIKIAIGGRHFADVQPKKMSSGKLGWFRPGKIHLTIGGVQVEAQVNINITIIHSEKFPDRVAEDSDLPADGTAPPANPADDVTVPPEGA